MGEHSERTSSVGPRRWPRRLRAGLVSLAVTLVVAELALRGLLFGAPASWRLAAGLRQPRYFARSANDDLFWELQYRWSDPQRRRPSPLVFDAGVGWLDPRVAPQTYAHEESALLDGRRPLLLYGDSFADCLTERGECFEGLIAQSELAQDFGLLNYGCGGYGLDQAYLLLRGSIDLYRESEPFVVFSVFIEGDVDRVALQLRDWSKPKFVERGGRWEVLPAVESSDLHLATRASGPWSYLERYLACGLGARAREGHRRAEKERITRHVLESLKADLEGRGVPFALMTFYSLRALRPDWAGCWEEDLLFELARELEIPLVSTRRDLLQANREAGKEARERKVLLSFYIPPGQPGAGHLSAEGNRIAFRAIERAVAGSFDPYVSALSER